MTSIIGLALPDAGVRRGEPAENEEPGLRLTRTFSVASPCL